MRTRYLVLWVLVAVMLSSDHVIRSHAHVVNGIEHREASEALAALSLLQEAATLSASLEPNTNNISGSSRGRTDDLLHASVYRDTGAPLSAFPDEDENRYQGVADAPEFGEFRVVANSRLDASGALLEEAFFWGDEEKCTRAVSDKPGHKLLAKLGRPRDSLYALGKAYFRHNGETATWEVNSERTLSGKGWKAVKDELSASFSKEARRMARDLHELRPLPIASSDVLEVLGCLNEKGYFEYDAGIFVTALYFKYLPEINRWHWSPDTKLWYPTSQLIVQEGKFKGQKPVQENVDIIQALEVYSVTGKSNLPTSFGQSWIEKGIRGAWRKVNELVTKHIIEAKEKLAKLKKTIASIDWDKIFGRVKQLLQKLDKYKGEVITTVIWGFMNGVFVGLLDMFREANSFCPRSVVEDTLVTVEDRFNEVSLAVRELFLNFSLSTVMPGFRRIAKAIKALLGSIMDVINVCPTLRDTLLVMIVMSGALFLINLMICATGFGAIFQLVLAFVSLYFVFPFLIGKGRSLGHSVGALMTAHNDGEKKVATLQAIEDTASIGGCIFSTIFLAKGLGKDLPAFLSKVSKSAGVASMKMAKFSGILKSGNVAKKMIGMLKGAKTGSKTATATAKSSAEGLLAASKVAAMNPGKSLAVFGKQVTSISGDSGTLIGATGLDKQANAAELADVSVEAMGIVERDMEKLAMRKKSGYTNLFGSVRASNGAAPTNIDDRWAAQDNQAAGLIGSGPPSQFLFWDTKKSVWRYGSHFPPAFRLLQSSLAQHAVGTLKVAGHDRPNVNICYVNALFCRGSKAPYCRDVAKSNPITFCDPQVPNGIQEKDFPFFERMPLMELLKAIEMRTGRIEFHRTTASMHVLTPTLEYISLARFAPRGDSIAENLAADGFYLWPEKDFVLVDRDNYILSGHESWAAAKWAARVAPRTSTPLQVKVFRLANLSAAQFFRGIKTLSPTSPLRAHIKSAPASIPWTRLTALK